MWPRPAHAWPGTRGALRDTRIPKATVVTAASQVTSAATGDHFRHTGRKRKRAPPGGRAAPARTVRPWGGRPVPSLCKLIHKVLPYATTGVFFAITFGVSAIRTTTCGVRHRHPLQRQLSALQHMPKGLRRVYRQIDYTAV